MNIRRPQIILYIHIKGIQSFWHQATPRVTFDYNPRLIGFDRPFHCNSPRIDYGHDGPFLICNADRPIKGNYLAVHVAIFTNPVAVITIGQVLVICYEGVAPIGERGSGGRPCF